MRDTAKDAEKIGAKLGEGMPEMLALQAALDALRADGRGLVQVGMEYEVARIVRDALAEQPAQGEAVARKYAPDYPEHDRMSCSDAEPFNATPAGSHGCARCTALVMDGAALPAPSVPEGWKLVPVEPTYVMVQAGAKLVKNNLPVHTGTLDIYKAMLAAAPEVPRG